MTLDALHVVKAMSGAAAGLLIGGVAEGRVAKASLFGVSHVDVNIGGVGRGGRNTVEDIKKVAPIVVVVVDDCYYNLVGDTV